MCKNGEIATDLDSQTTTVQVAARDQAEASAVIERLTEENLREQIDDDNLKSKLTAISKPSTTDVPLPPTTGLELVPAGEQAQAAVRQQSFHVVGFVAGCGVVVLVLFAGVVWNRLHRAKRASTSATPRQEPKTADNQFLVYQMVPRQSSSLGHAIP